MILCPYCGSLSAQAKQCTQCNGHFDLLSRQRSQNAMGPWFIRESARPFSPGCSYSTLVAMTKRGKIKPETVLRGPSTRQFWSFARSTPGISHLLGECHACHSPVMPIAKLCSACNASFVVDEDRQNMGLSPVRLLPGDADTATIAASIGSSPSQAPVPRQVVVPESPVPEPLPELISEAVAQAVPSFPIPAVKVIAADESSGRSSIAVVLTVGMIAVMMGGAAIWAWVYLGDRNRQTENNLSPSTSEKMPVAETLSSDEESDLGLELVADPGGSQSQLAEDLVGSAEDTTDSNPSEKLPRVDELDAEQDTSKLSYDRILAGIADGSLTDEQFESLLLNLDPDVRQRLIDQRQRRLDQRSLGKNGG